MRWTQDQLNEFMAKFHRPIDEQDKPDPGKESKLQGKIMSHCKEWGWVCQCFRQSKKARGFLIPGLPD